MRRGGAELCFKVPRDPASKRVHAMHMRALARLETGLGRGGVECGGPFFFPASRSAGMHLLEAPPIRMPGQLLQARLHCWVLRPRARLRLQSLGRCRLGLILWGLRAWGGLTGGKVQANPPTCEEDADAFVQSCRLPAHCRVKPGFQAARPAEGLSREPPGSSSSSPWWLGVEVGPGLSFSESRQSWGAGGLWSQHLWPH